MGLVVGHEVETLQPPVAPDVHEAQSTRVSLLEQILEVT
jgi:hypothetical protein